MAESPIILDQPDQIRMWVILSRMHQLALELNSGMRASRYQVLEAMFLEGLLPEKLRGTEKNKRLVLQALADAMPQLIPGWVPGPTVVRALAK